MSHIGLSGVSSPLLDQNPDCLETLLRARADQAMDVVNLKISKLGGLTKTPHTKTRPLH